MADLMIIATIALILLLVSGLPIFLVFLSVNAAIVLFQLGPSGYGMFVNTIITFLIVAFSIFLVVRFYNKIKDKFEAEEEESPATPTTPHKEELLLTEIRDLLKKK